MNILLLFLLFTASNDPKFGENFRSFLAFYRENRDFLTAFAKNEGTMSEQCPSEECGQEKNRPREGDGAGSVFEQFLGSF